MKTTHIKIRMLAPSQPILMWAAINVAGSRSEWIHHYTIRATRREAKDAHLKDWYTDTKSVKRALSWVRFARVVVSVEA